MMKYWIIRSLLIVLLAACSDKQQELEISDSIIKAPQKARSTLEKVANIPQVNLSSNYYNAYEFENNYVTGWVDSLNQKQGYWVIQSAKNNFTYQGNYLDDLPEGWWEVLVDETLVCAGHYRQNKREGYWRFLQIGQHKHSMFVNYVQDTLHGLAREYYLDSILISDGHFLKGLKNGYWKYYHPNGMLKAQGYYHNSQKSGWWQSFNDQGEILMEAGYAGDQIAGYVKRYRHGILLEEGQEVNGENIGIWKFYDAQGQLLKIEEFDE